MPPISAPPPFSEVTIWEQIIHPTGSMSRDTAERIAVLEFTTEERERMHALAERNRAGTLAPSEDEELDNYCRVGTTLSYLKSRARQVLKSRRRVP